MPVVKQQISSQGEFAKAREELAQLDATIASASEPAPYNHARPRPAK